MRNRWLGLGVVVLLAGGVWGVGCGSSDSDGGGGGAAGAAGAGGSGGSGGTAGTEGGTEAAAGSGGGATEAGTDAKKDAPVEAAPTTCAGQTCSPLVVIPNAISLDACCATSAGEGDVCGLDLGMVAGMMGLNPPNTCIAKNQPGAEDANCPDYCFSTSYGDVLFKGCKNTDTDSCGAMANTVSLSVAGVPITANLDLGCVTPEQLGAPAGGLACGDGGTTEAGTDAGDTDAGDTDAGDTDAGDDAPAE